ncbi:Uncharacterised protein g3521 [Pycnogonum litorale]
MKTSFPFDLTMVSTVEFNDVPDVESPNVTSGRIYPDGAKCLIRLSRALGLLPREIPYIFSSPKNVAGKTMAFSYWFVLYALYTVVCIYKVVLNVTFYSHESSDTNKILSILLTTATQLTLSICHIFLLFYFLSGKVGRKLSEVWTNCSKWCLGPKKASDRPVYFWIAVMLMLFLFRLGWVFYLQFSNCIGTEHGGHCLHHEDTLPSLSKSTFDVLVCVVIVAENAMFFVPFVVLMLYYVTVRLLKGRLRYINERIGEKKFEDIHNLIYKHYLLRQQLDDINELFGPPLFMILGTNILSTLGELYTLLMHLDADHIITFLLLVYLVIFLCLVGTNFENEMNRSLKNLEYFMLCPELSSGAKLKVLSIMMNLTQNTPVLSAAGYFRINKNFFVSVIVAMATYTAIVFQFVLAADTGENAGHDDH